jgi:hypothetical protein
MTEQISFQATFFKATTTVDGGLRISLDIPEHQAQIFVDLMKCQKRVLEVAIIPHPPEQQQRHGF